MTSAAGIAVGLGQLGLAFVVVILTWAILSLLAFLSAKLNPETTLLTNPGNQRPSPRAL